MWVGLVWGCGELFAVDAAERSGVLAKRGGALAPARIGGIQRAAQVGGGGLLDEGDPRRVLVGGLRSSVAGNSSLRVFCPKYGQQTLFARTEMEGVRAPVRTPDAEGGLVFVSRDDEGGVVISVKLWFRKG